MYILKNIIVLVLTITLFIAVFPTDSFAVTLQEGTPVILRLTEEVGTKTKNLNDQVFLEVARDVVVDGKVVIKQGTPAIGTVTWMEQPSMVGGEGKIQFNIESTKTIDDKKVLLRSTATRMGQDQKAPAIALGIICCPLFLLMKGKEASFPIGTEFKAYTEYPVEVGI